MSDDLVSLIEWFEYVYEDIDLDIEEADEVYKHFLIGEKLAFKEFLAKAKSVDLVSLIEWFTHVYTEKDLEVEETDGVSKYILIGEKSAFKEFLEKALQFSHMN